RHGPEPQRDGQDGAREPTLLHRPTPFLSEGITCPWTRVSSGRRERRSEPISTPVRNSAKSRSRASTFAAGIDYSDKTERRLFRLLRREPAHHVLGDKIRRIAVYEVPSRWNGNQRQILFNPLP